MSQWDLDTYTGGRYVLNFNPKGVTYQGHLDWLTDEDFYALYLKLMEWGFVTKAQEAADRKLFKPKELGANYESNGAADPNYTMIFRVGHP